MGLDADFYVPLTADISEVERIVGNKLRYQDGDFWVVSTCDYYFGPGYTRGDWPTIRSVLVELGKVAPGLRYGAGDYPPAPDLVTPEFIETMDRLWDETVAMRNSRPKEST